MPPPHKNFKPGGSVGEALNAKWLNSIEKRLRILENTSIAGPVELRHTADGRVFQLTKRIDNHEIVRLAEDLDPLGEAQANLLRNSEDDGNTEDSDNPITVMDLSNMSSDEGEIGLAFEHTSAEKLKYVFVPLEGNKKFSSSMSASSGSDTIVVLTDYRVDDENYKLQKREITISGVTIEVEESGWLDVHTGVACSSSSGA